MDNSWAVAQDHSPERQLWCAVIGRALDDALGNPGGISESIARHRATLEARNWFVENGLDFQRACGAAGYEPELLRDRVLRMVGLPDDESSLCAAE